MKQRQRKKQFWWTWHHCTQLYPYYSKLYGWFDWGVGRIKHQLRNTSKDKV